MALNFHAKAEIGLMAALLLSSCNAADSEFSDAEQVEIAAIAADSCDDLIVSHRHIAEMNDRLKEVERKLAYQ